MAFDTILVANRGEIAARVIRTARDLGLRCVAVYTTADAAAPHVALADEAVWIGDGPVGDSYLNGARILSAAEDTGAGAIHPGYGFLSENAEFAQAVETAGMIFIGPRSDAIRAMGDKAQAKRLMIEAGVPCIPGYEGADQSDATLVAAADKIGFPIMVKAAAGGGGRGMRLVADPDALPQALAAARSEAENAFGSGHLILERAIVEPRHVEIQILADAHGNIIHLGERDCSVQRRHQKVIEEAPCPVMTPDLRDRMGAAAVQAARAVDYRGAGTVEFLLQEDGSFFFLEMNTRLQVEHPVTEMVTGLDLVALQIAIAQGEPLSLTQEDVRLDGHAIEVRLYAEDPANGYLPATGPVDLWHPAEGPGIRVDAGVAQGQDISPFYDPMLAKIIAHGPSRAVARARLLRAVRETVLLGTVTNAGFLDEVLQNDDFAQGKATTGLLDRTYPEGFPAPKIAPRDAALGAALLMQHQRDSALARAGFVAPDQLGWSSSALTPRRLRLVAGDEVIDCAVLAAPAGWQVRIGEQEFSVTLQTDGHDIRARINDQTVDAVALVSEDQAQLAIGSKRITLRQPRAGVQAESAQAGGQVRAPMPGLVLEVAVAPGDTVDRGQRLAVIEAMKMQHEITAQIPGKVSGIFIKPDQQLAAGALMIEIEDI